MNPVTKYTRTAMLLHWLIAFLIALNLGLVWVVDSLPEDMTRPIIDMHKSIGITVLGLALMRLLWRCANPPPPLPTDYRPWERRCATVAHWTLYLLILFLPVSGWMHDSAWKDAPTHPMHLFGLIAWPRIGWIMNTDPATREALHDAFFGVHKYLAYVLYGFVVVHIGAALKHQFFDKEPELQRMLP